MLVWYFYKKCKWSSAYCISVLAKIAGQDKILWNVRPIVTIKAREFRLNERVFEKWKRAD